jgi:hypothetical protein
MHRVLRATSAEGDGSATMRDAIAFVFDHAGGQSRAVPRERIEVRFLVHFA